MAALLNTTFGPDPNYVAGRAQPFETIAWRSRNATPRTFHYNNEEWHLKKIFCGGYGHLSLWYRFDANNILAEVRHTLVNEFS